MKNKIVSVWHFALSSVVLAQCVYVLASDTNHESGSKLNVNETLSTLECKESESGSGCSESDKRKEREVTGTRQSSQTLVMPLIDYLNKFSNIGDQKEPFANLQNLVDRMETAAKNLEVEEANLSSEKRKEAEQLRAKFRERLAKRIQILGYYQVAEFELFRELGTNAVDSTSGKARGLFATREQRIVNFYSDPKKGQMVTEDFGEGMNFDTVVRKLLALGQSGKEGQSNAIGEFGQGFYSTISMLKKKGDKVRVRTEPINGEQGYEVSIVLTADVVQEEKEEKESKGPSINPASFLEIRIEPFQNRKRAHGTRVTVDSSILRGTRSGQPITQYIENNIIRRNFRYLDQVQIRFDGVEINPPLLSEVPGFQVGTGTAIEGRLKIPGKKLEEGQGVIHLNLKGVLVKDFVVPRGREIYSDVVIELPLLSAKATDRGQVDFWSDNAKAFMQAIYDKAKIQNDEVLLNTLAPILGENGYNILDQLNFEGLEGPFVPATREFADLVEVKGKKVKRLNKELYDRIPNPELPSEKAIGSLPIIRAKFRKGSKKSVLIARVARRPVIFLDERIPLDSSQLEKYVIQEIYNTKRQYSPDLPDLDYYFEEKSKENEEEREEKESRRSEELPDSETAFREFWDQYFWAYCQEVQAEFLDEKSNEQIVKNKNSPQKWKDLGIQIFEKAKIALKGIYDFAVEEFRTSEDRPFSEIYSDVFDYSSIRSDLPGRNSILLDLDFPPGEALATLEVMLPRRLLAMGDRELHENMVQLRSFTSLVRSRMKPSDPKRTKLKDIRSEVAILTKLSQSNEVPIATLNTDLDRAREIVERSITFKDVEGAESRLVEVSSKFLEERKGGKKDGKSLENERKSDQKTDKISDFLEYLGFLQELVIKRAPNLLNPSETSDLKFQYNHYLDHLLNLADFHYPNRDVAPDDITAYAKTFVSRETVFLPLNGSSEAKSIFYRYRRPWIQIEKLYSASDRIRFASSFKKMNEFVGWFCPGGSQSRAILPSITWNDAVKGKIEQNCHDFVKGQLDRMIQSKRNPEFLDDLPDLREKWIAANRKAIGQGRNRPAFELADLKTEAQIIALLMREDVGLLGPNSASTIYPLILGGSLAPKRENMEFPRAEVPMVKIEDDPDVIARMKGERIAVEYRKVMSQNLDPWNWMKEVPKNSKEAHASQFNFDVSKSKLGELILEMWDTGDGVPKEFWDSFYIPGVSAKDRGGENINFGQGFMSLFQYFDEVTVEAWTPESSGKREKYLIYLRKGADGKLEIAKGTSEELAERSGKPEVSGDPAFTKGVKITCLKKGPLSPMTIAELKGRLISATAGMGTKAADGGTPMRVHFNGKPLDELSVGGAERLLVERPVLDVEKTKGTIKIFHGSQSGVLFGDFLQTSRLDQYLTKFPEIWDEFKKIVPGKFLVRIDGDLKENSGRSGFIQHEQIQPQVEEALLHGASELLVQSLLEHPDHLKLPYDFFYEYRFGIPESSDSNASGAKDIRQVQNADELEAFVLNLPVGTKHLSLNGIKKSVFDYLVRKSLLREDKNFRLDVAWDGKAFVKEMTAKLGKEYKPILRRFQQIIAGKIEGDREQAKLEAKATKSKFDDSEKMKTGSDPEAHLKFDPSKDYIPEEVPDDWKGDQPYMLMMRDQYKKDLENVFPELNVIIKFYKEPDSSLAHAHKGQFERGWILPAGEASTARRNTKRKRRDVVISYNLLGSDFRDFRKMLLQKKPIPKIYAKGRGDAAHEFVHGQEDEHDATHNRRFNEEMIEILTRYLGKSPSLYPSL